MSEVRGKVGADNGGRSEQKKKPESLAVFTWAPLSGLIPFTCNPVTRRSESDPDPGNPPREVDSIQIEWIECG